VGLKLFPLEATTHVSGQTNYGHKSSSKFNHNLPTPAGQVPRPFRPSLRQTLETHGPKP